MAYDEKKADDSLKYCYVTMLTTVLYLYLKEVGFSMLEELIVLKLQRDEVYLDSEAVSCY